MPRRYDDFTGRVNFAASTISQGRKPTRAFDGCFEMDDGDFVAIALYLRTIARPDTRLAANIWRYLDRETVTATAAEHPGIRASDLPELAKETRERCKAAWAAKMAEFDRRRQA